MEQVPLGTVITPAGNPAIWGIQGCQTLDSKSSASDSGGTTLSAITPDRSEGPPSHKIKPKHNIYIGTLNIQTLIKVGKQMELTKALQKHNIKILAVQETRIRSEEISVASGYRIFKSKAHIQSSNQAILGTAFLVHSSIVKSIISFKAISPRLSVLTIKCANKAYTLVNAHAPINQDNSKDPEKVETFWSLLDDTLSDIKTPVILLGDFNAQLGKERKFRNTVGRYPVHNRTNRNGERFIELCSHSDLTIMTTFFKKNPRTCKTWRPPNQLIGERQIDHVAITSQNRREIRNVKVLRGANIDSDHYLTKVRVRFIPKAIRTSQQNRTEQKVHKFRINELKINDQVINDYQKELDSLKSSAWEDISKKILDAASQTIKLVGKKKHPWWTEQCDEALRRRSQAWNRWNETGNIEEFLSQRKLTAKIFRCAKRQYEKSQLEEVEEAFRKNNTRTFYQTFKSRLVGYQAPSLCFKDEEGNLLLNNHDNCERLARYFESLLNCPPPTSKIPSSIASPKVPNSSPPDVKELSEIINSLPNNKTSGNDSIVAELLKMAGPNFIAKMEVLFQDIWVSETIPSEWQSALIHPLHKKGDKTDVNNYRGISLLPVAYKILSKALQNRIEPVVDPQIGEYQAGFRKGRSCSEQIFSLRSIIKIRSLRSKPLVMTFVDFKKAYDSIDRTTLLDILEEMGVDDKTHSIIKQTLSNTYSQVKFMGEISRPFEIKTGVRQGDGLSPLLFNCVLEKVIREWKRRIPKNGIRLGVGSKAINVDCLAFADDIVLLAEDLDTARFQVETLKEVAEATGLQISFEKTELMMSDRKNPTKYLETKYGNIKRSTKFKYLGEIITFNDSEKEALRYRAKRMDTAFYLCKKTYASKSLSWQAKFRHYATVVRPEALYGSECLALSHSGELEKLLVKERKLFRKILGPRQNSKGEYRLKSNNELYSKFEKLSTAMRKRRLSFYGHLSRMNPNRLGRRIIDLLKSWKCTTPWANSVKNDLSGTSEEIVHDRGQYRAWVRGMMDLPEKVRRKSGAKWSDDRKATHSNRMKEYWKSRKFTKC